VLHLLVAEAVEVVLEVLVMEGVDQMFKLVVTVVTEYIHQSLAQILPTLAAVGVVETEEPQEQEVLVSAEMVVLQV
jgi:hypothetical protein